MKTWTFTNWKKKEGNWILLTFVKVPLLQWNCNSWLHEPESSMSFRIWSICAFLYLTGISEHFAELHLSNSLSISSPIGNMLKILWISVKFDGNLHSTSIGGWFKWWPSGSSRKRPLFLIPCSANWKQDFSEADKLCNSSTFSLNFSFSTSFCCKVFKKSIKILSASLNNAF